MLSSERNSPLFTVISCCTQWNWMQRYEHTLKTTHYLVYLTLSKYTYRWSKIIFSHKQTTKCFILYVITHHIFNNWTTSKKTRFVSLRSFQSRSVRFFWKWKGSYFVCHNTNFKSSTTTEIQLSYLTGKKFGGSECNIIPVIIYGSAKENFSVRKCYSHWLKNKGNISTWVLLLMLRA